jgi:hypothetical protein
MATTGLRERKKARTRQLIADTAARLFAERGYENVAVGDWVTVVTNAAGTFTGEMTLPDGSVIPPTGKAFDLEFAQTSKWEGDELIIISAFWDAALQARQLGLAP